MDVTLGEPSHHELFCLRASPKKFPLASEVPYNLSSEFKQQATRSIDAFLHNGGAEASSAGGGTEETTSFFKRLAGLTGWGAKRTKPGEAENVNRL